MLFRGEGDLLAILLRTFINHAQKFFRLLQGKDYSLAGNPRKGQSLSRTAIVYNVK